MQFKTKKFARLLVPLLMPVVGAAAPALANALNFVRAIEIPTPRWTAYDSAKFKVKMTPDVTMIQQERAVTSPIWYTP